MKWICGYIRTIRQYLATPKGAYDSRDYGEAILLILITISLLLVLLAVLEGRI